MFTFRPKLGVSSGAYIYATGGWAWTEFKGQWSFANAPHSEHATATKWTSGWALGAGIEAGLSEHIKIGAEYICTSAFGSISGSGVIGAPATPPFSNVFNHTADLTDEVARARISYTF